MTKAPYALFINPLWIGHIPPYMQMIWPFFLQRGWRIHQAVDQPEEAGRFCAAQFGEDSSSISHSGIPGIQPEPGLSQTEWCEKRWEALGQVVAQIRAREGEPALVFHAWADLWTHPFLSSGCVRRALPLPWVGICLHPVELRVHKTWKRRWWELIPNLWQHRLPTESRLRALRAPELREVLILDENLLEKARRFFPGPRVSAFPDIANVAVSGEFRLPALEKLRSEGRPILAVLGVLQKRKGFLRLMEAARAAPGNWGFLFAGKVAWNELAEHEREDLQRFIADPPANTALYLEFMDDETQLNPLMTQADLLYLAYEDFFHSSNIQTKAAFYRKPCLTGPIHLIAERTGQYGLGWTLKDHSAATLIDFLARTDRAALEEKARTARFGEFYEQHSRERLDRVLTRLIEPA